MRACLLNNSEACALEQFGKLPNCQNHKHVSFNDAMINVECDIWRWVSGTYDMTSRRRVTPTPEIGGYANRPCVIRDNFGHVEGVVYTKQAIIIR